jgi:predicted Zn finger-like uncharacterized protein
LPGKIAGSRLGRMFIGCPNCSANYQVDEASLRRARTLRCARCHHTWRHVPNAPPPIATTDSFAIICPGCATSYRIPLARFPAAGRQVRCGNCQHLWHQLPPPPRPTRGLSPAEKKDLYIALGALLAAREQALKKSISAAPAATARNADVLQEPEPFSDTVGFSDPPFKVPTAIAALSGSDGPLEPNNTHYTSVLPPEASEQPFFERNFERLFGSAVAVTILLLVLGGIHTRIFGRAGWPFAQMPAAALGISIQDINYRREPGIGGHTNLIIDGRIENSAPKALAMPRVIRIRLNDADHQELYETVIEPSATVLGSNQSIAFETEIYDAPPKAIEMQVSLDQKF